MSLRHEVQDAIDTAGRLLEQQRDRDRQRELVTKRYKQFDLQDAR